MIDSVPIDLPISASLKSVVPGGHFLGLLCPVLFLWWVVLAFELPLQLLHDLELVARPNPEFGHPLFREVPQVLQGVDLSMVEGGDVLVEEVFLHELLQVLALDDFAEFDFGLAEVALNGEGGALRLDTGLNLRDLGPRGQLLLEPFLLHLGN